MRVLLAGATGTLGTVLVPQLISAGHAVIGLTRSESGAGSLAMAGAEPVVADVMDRRALLAALAGTRADAVIHEATAITSTPITHRDLHPTNALRTHGTTNLLRAAERVGARRFITQSFFLGYGYRDHGKRWLTEDDPFAPRGRGHFERHLAAMRANEDQTFNTPGVDGIALRYGFFYGPERSTRSLFDLVRRRRLPMPSPAGVTCPLHIADAASATVAALEKGVPGEAYNVVDDQPIGFDDYIATLASAANAPTPRRIPGWALRVTPYLHALMVGTRIRLSNEKAKRELSWTPTYPSCFEGLTAVVRAETNRQ